MLLALGFQHVAVIYPYLVMDALVVAAVRLPRADARNAMGLASVSCQSGPRAPAYLLT